MSTSTESRSVQKFAGARLGKNSLRTYIYYSTLVGIFSGILTFRTPFAINVFDLLMIVNLILMVPLVSVRRMSPWILLLILYLGVSGCIGIAYGTDTIGLASKELVGISVTVVYFYYFFRMINNDFERAFSSYATIALWFTIIAFPIWAGECLYLHRFERLRGLTPEPTEFCFLVLPAYYWYTNAYFKFRQHGGKVIVFTSAIILAGSSNGYLSVAIGAVLLLSGRAKHLVAVPVVVVSLLTFAYTLSPDFRERADDTIIALSAQNVSGSNLSTYALVSNMLVTRQVLKESPLIGNGLGSHPISHARFIGEVPGAENFIDNGWIDFNATDAASLTLRTLSELGIFGFASVLLFLFHFYVGGTSSYAAISKALLVCFLLKLLREGGYFPPEQFFFTFIFVLNHRKYRISSKVTRSHASSRLPTNYQKWNTRKFPASGQAAGFIQSPDGDRRVSEW